MSGELDPQYVVARGVLLDALQALGEQREAVILVGAQAIYLHTGAIELPVAEFTIDADLTLDPSLLRQSPELESALNAARQSEAPGSAGFRMQNRDEGAGRKHQDRYAVDFPTHAKVLSHHESSDTYHCGA